MKTPVKTALVGISGYGDSYLRSLLAPDAAEKIQLVGLVDPAPERCRRLEEIRTRGIPIHAGVEALLAEARPELLMLATPIHLHAPHTCLALSRGVNVLCEKPLAGGLNDGVRMIEAERASGRFAAIGYQWSFSRAVQALKADVLAGTLGRPRRLKTLVSFPRPLSYFKRNDWAGRIRSAGGVEVHDSPVNNATAHYLHNMLYILGQKVDRAATPESVQAELYRANDIENYDTAALRCAMPGGVEVLFYTTHSARQQFGPSCVFEFENATVKFDQNNSAEFVAKFRDGTLKSYGNPNLDREAKIWQCVQAARDGGAVVCNTLTALPHLLCVIAAQQSMAIAEFPGDLIVHVDEGDDTMLVIPGLFEALTECFARGVLPSERGGLDWARAGKAVSVASPALNGQL